MRNVLRFAIVGTALLLPASGFCRQDSQKQNQQDQPVKADAPASPAPEAQTGTAPQDSLAAAARKARAQKKEAPKTTKVFTNDNLPATGGISSVGKGAAESTETAGSTSAKTSTSDAEKTWRERFAKLHHQLEKDQQELDVMQRELNVDEVQYYGGDPQKAYQDQTSQQPFGAEYDKKKATVDSKLQQVQADQQAIDDAEDELRKSGGDPGWAH